MWLISIKILNLSPSGLIFVLLHFPSLILFHYPFVHNCFHQFQLLIYISQNKHQFCILKQSVAAIFLLLKTFLKVIYKSSLCSFVKNMSCSVNPKSDLKFCLCCSLLVLLSLSLVFFHSSTIFNYFFCDIITNVLISDAVVHILCYFL